GYVALAQAYELVTKFQNGWTGRTPFGRLQSIRLIQRIVALQNALVLKPDALTPHFMLFDLYRQLKYRDLALEHLNGYFKNRQAAGPNPGEPLENYQKEMENLANEVRTFEDQVQKVKDKHELETANKAPL